MTDAAERRRTVEDNRRDALTARCLALAERPRVTCDTCGGEYITAQAPSGYALRLDPTGAKDGFWGPDSDPRTPADMVVFRPTRKSPFGTLAFHPHVCPASARTTPTTNG